ncbi:MAG TPA: chorismate synthase, partial [Flammeovirgaceae bacterium]|nr:chorismate synthase [Flammeovirgaceae bacterium]
DYTYQVKYGLRDYRGGGRASARITAGWVAAGAIAKQLLAPMGIKIAAYVSKVGTIELSEKYSAAQLEGRQEDEVRCPDTQISRQMAAAIKEARKQGDTLGGVVSCSVSGVPAGLGEPVFNKLHAQLGKAMLSINAVKGFEYGSGFAGAAMRGSEHNDIFTKTEDGISTRTNYSGGIQGGISNGQEIYFRVAFKPVATIMQDQPGIDREGKATTVQGKGRHDPCVVPRAVPIVEAMTALVLADFVLMNQTAKLGG